jgi:hypothetical protein
MVCPPTMPRTGRPAQAESESKMKTHETRKAKGQVIPFTVRLISLKSNFINQLAEFVILKILN